VDVKEVHERFIDVLVQSSDDVPQSRFTCVYGEPRVEHRHLMWAQLSDQQARYDHPWIVVGDFNECMWSFEYFFSTPRAEAQMAAFRDSMDLCGLINLDFSGVPHTYDNKRAGHANVKVRLDRAVATNSWHTIFPFYSVKHLVTPCSDHVALLIKGELEESSIGRKRYRQFEVMREHDHTLPEVIKNSWDSVGDIHDLGDIVKPLDKTMSKLHDWSKSKFGCVRDELQKSCTQLEELMHMNADRQEIKKGH
jgi:hypothetical protein